MRYEDLEPGDSIIVNGISKKEVYTLLSPPDELGYSKWLDLSEDTFCVLELPMTGELPSHYQVCRADK